MTAYHTGRKAINAVDASFVAVEIGAALKSAQQGAGMDGLDVALGTLSALRDFVLWNVGPEGIKQELETLADILANGESE